MSKMKVNRIENTATTDGGIDIDSSGKVGIGTSSPGVKLHVNGSTPTLRVSHGTSQVVEIKADTSASILRTTTNHPLLFGTNDTERLRILSDGKLGLGTSSPGQLLHLNSSASTAIQISDGTNNQFISSIKTAGNFANGSTAGDLLIRGQSGFAVSPNNGSSVALRVDSSGNVGISTTSADRTLHVRKDNAAAVKFGGESGGDYAIEIGQLGSSSSPGFNATGGSSMLFKMGGTEAARLDSSGNLGLCTSSPVFGVGTGLEVFRSGVSTVRVSSNNQAVELRSDAGTGTLETRGAFPLKFGTQGSERLRITSDGKVGIGTSSADSTLELAAGPPRLKLTRNTTASTGNDFGRIVFENSAGTILSRIDCESTSGNTQSALTFSNGGSERLRISSDGKVGIGCTPVRDLQLHTPDASSELMLSNSTTGATAGSGFMIQQDGNDNYIWNKENSFMSFGTNANERMRLDSSGRLLVGTSSAQTLPTASSFQVSGTDFATSSIRQTRFESGTSGPSIILAHARGSEASNQSLANNDELGKIRFYGHDGTDFNNWGAEIIGEVDGTPGSNDMPGRLLFRTTASGSSSPTERMRITSGGNVGIGDTSPGGRLDIGFNSSSVVGLVLSNAGTGTSARFYSGSSIVGSITVSGSATAFNTSSDYRLKENVVGITDGITRVKQLSPRRFNFIADDTTTVDGFIAHEAQTVVPEAVTGEKDGEEMQGIDQSKLVPLLTAALQEAITKIETLETKVAALEAG